MTTTDLLLVSVGNTRTRVARARVGEGPGGKGELEPSRVLLNADRAALLAGVLEAAQGMEVEPAQVLLASVNDPMAEEVARVLRAPDLPPVVRVGTGAGLRVPMQTDLPPPITVGVDRLLAALGAYQRTGGACVVIDAGTAVTVDFVDNFGVFRGGVIAPGLAMMLRSLHERTAALPALDPPRSADAVPEGPMGRTTAEAMTLGCAGAVVGLCHRLIDKYAEANGSYPRVVATGGDAPLLFQRDELVEAVVPDLVLIGMHSAWQIARGGEGAAGEAGPRDDGDDDDGDGEDSAFG